MHGELARTPRLWTKAGAAILVLFLASNGVLAVAPPLAEELPPIGKGHMLSEEQVAYCLAQGIRVEAMRTLVNRYRREQVDFFNAVVAGFNARCQSYRYEGDARDNAKAQVEAHRAQIEADARDSYALRFPAQQKEQEKAPASASTAPSSVAAVPSSPSPTPSTPAVKPASSAPATEPRGGAGKPAPGSLDTGSSSAAAKPAPDVAAAVPPIPAADTAPAAKPSPSVSATVPTAPASAPGGTAAAPASDAAAKPASTGPAVAPDGAATSLGKPGAATTGNATKPGSSVSAVTPSIPGAVTTPPKGEIQPAAVPGAPTTPPKSETQPAAAPAAATAPRPSATGRATTNAPVQPAPSSPRAAKPEPSLANAQPSASSKPAAPSKTKAEIDAEAALDRFSREIRRAGSQVVADNSVPAAADKGTAQIDVRYASGGYIKSIDVGESSGYAALDERALDIARNIRFPNVPQELQSRDFVLRFPIVFRSTAAR